MLGPPSGCTSSNCISPCHAKRVAERELHLFAVVAHLLEPRRLEPVGRPGADPELLGPAPHRLVQVLDDHRALLERRCEQWRDAPAHGRAPMLVAEAEGRVDRLLGSRDRAVGDLGDAHGAAPAAWDSATAQTPATARRPPQPVDLRCDGRRRRHRRSRRARSRSSPRRPRRTAGRTRSPPGRRTERPLLRARSRRAPSQLGAAQSDRSPELDHDRRHRSGPAGRTSTRAGHARCAGPTAGRARTARSTAG